MFNKSLIQKFLSAALSAIMLTSASAMTGHTESISTIKGDIDLNGKVDTDDLSVLSLYLLGKTTITKHSFYNADMDDDRTVDSIDLVSLRKYIIHQNLSNVTDISTTTTATNAALPGTTTVRSKLSINNSPLNAPLYWQKYSSKTNTDNSLITSSTAAEDEFIKAPISEMFGTLSSQAQNRICVFYIDFPDCRYEYEPSADVINKAAFGGETPDDPYFPHESINAFYQRSSKHTEGFSGASFRYTTKNEKSYYENDPYKVKLIDEIISSFNYTVDFSRFDGNGDNIIDAMILSVPQNAGSDNWRSRAGRYAGSLYQTIDGISMGQTVVGNAEIDAGGDCTTFVSTYCHELGHCMGLPDYYLYGQYGADGLHGSAGFDIMDKLYCDFSCASKLMLGWYKGGQIQIFDYNGSNEQTFKLTDGQSENGNCVIIPFDNILDPNYCSEYMIIEYSSLNNNNKAIPQKYWWGIFGSGIRIFHVIADIEEIDNEKFLMYRSEDTADYVYGRRFIRVVNDFNIDNLFHTGSFINNKIKGFSFYGCAGDENIDPYVEIYVGELEGDSYNITIRKKG